METMTIDWKKKLEFARKSTLDTDVAVMKEYESSPGAYAAPQSLFDREREAWKALEGIPKNILSKSDRERCKHFNITVSKSVKAQASPSPIKIINQRISLWSKIKKHFCSFQNSFIQKKKEKPVVRQDPHERDKDQSVNEWGKDLAEARRSTKSLEFYRELDDKYAEEDRDEFIPIDDIEIGVAKNWLKIRDIPREYLTGTESSMLDYYIRDAENGRYGEDFCMDNKHVR